MTALKTLTYLCKIKVNQRKELQQLKLCSYFGNCSSNHQLAGVIHVGKVTYSINGFRLGLSSTLKDLKEDLDSVLDDVDHDTAERIRENFNELACSANSINCVYVEDLDGFDDLSNEPNVPLFDT